jgi:energy-coupling factor transporter ATP-binding protein EcfA2
VLNRVEVRNFQSLAHADVKLDWFTVITGPTGSGKSGFLRALELLAFNARGTGYVTAGAKTCTVSAADERMMARITRSTARSVPDSYQLARLVPVPVGGYGWSGVKYTKLGGQVPPRVTEALGLTPLNFSRQFDAPFLLGLPGTQLAQRLGELTNVSLVLGAAAGANRVRKQLQRQLDEAVARHDKLLEQVQLYAGLGDRRKAVTTAEEALERYLLASQRLERLRALTGRLEAAEAASRAAEAEAARQAPPSLGKLDGLLARRARLRQLTRAVIDADREIALADGEVTRAAAAEVTAEATLHTALAAAGECPVCGQRVR